MSIELNFKAPELIYEPTKWCVLKIAHNGEEYHKVLGGWDLELEDRWRLNSGVVEYDFQEGKHLFLGYSSSVYVCDPAGYGTTEYSNAILTGFLEEVVGSSSSIEVLPESTDWTTMVW